MFAAVERLCCNQRTQAWYAICYAEDYGTVTFSLCSKVWKGISRPEIGEEVVIDDIRQIKGKGWRAKYARPQVPSDKVLAAKQEAGEEHADH